MLAWVVTGKLGARAGKHNLGARANKYKLEAKTEVWAASNQRRKLCTLPVGKYLTINTPQLY